MHQNSFSTSKTFLVKKGKEFHILHSDNVAVFYTDNKLTFALDNTGAKILVQPTLIELEAKLDERSFFRASRQFLVNRKFISKIKQLSEYKFQIVTDPASLVPIDINQKKFYKLKAWIENNC